MVMICTWFKPNVLWEFVLKTKNSWKQKKDQKDARRPMTSCSKYLHTESSFNLMFAQFIEFLNIKSKKKRLGKVNMTVNNECLTSAVFSDDKSDFFRILGSFFGKTDLFFFFSPSCSVIRFCGRFSSICYIQAIRIQLHIRTLVVSSNIESIKNVPFFNKPFWFMAFHALSLSTVAMTLTYIFAFSVKRFWLLLLSVFERSFYYVVMVWWWIAVEDKEEYVYSSSVIKTVLSFLRCLL